MYFFTFTVSQCEKNTMASYSLEGGWSAVDTRAAILLEREARRVLGTSTMPDGTSVSRNRTGFHTFRRYTGEAKGGERVRLRLTRGSMAAAWSNVLLKFHGLVQFAR